MRTYSGGKKTKDDVMTSTECSQSRPMFGSVQETLTFKMGRHFISMRNFQTKSTSAPPAVIRKAQVMGKHARARSVHVGWAQVVEELSWKFNKVS